VSAMSSVTARRHMMPAVTLATFVATVLPAGRPARGHLALGVALLLLYWLVEWRGIQGTFDGRSRGPSRLGRAGWLVGLVLCVADTLWLHWTPFQGTAVRAAGVAIFLAGVLLRLWAMRTLARAFSYDLKIVDGHELVRRGPYRVLRHPSYTGLLLWSIGFALWNPSLPGLAVLVASMIAEVSRRVRVEEQLLAAHFGDAWRRHAEATWAVIPAIW
jgi:protein-S-isoprenylcysteine O-methyltransferase